MLALGTLRNLRDSNRFGRRIMRLVNVFTNERDHVGGTRDGGQAGVPAAQARDIVKCSRMTSREPRLYEAKISITLLVP
jgi:hypothetical protein